MEVLRRLESKDDPVEMWKLQGRLRQITILEQLPMEVDALDEALEKSDLYLRMEADSARGNGSREKGR